MWHLPKIVQRWLADRHGAATKLASSRTWTVSGRRGTGQDPAAADGQGHAAGADGVPQADRPGHHRRRGRTGLRGVHPLPLHRLPGRSGLRLGGVGRTGHAVLHQPGDRALHPGHGRDRADRFQPVLAALGTLLRDLDLLRQPVAGLGDQQRHPRLVHVRRDAALHRHRHADRDRFDLDAGPGGLRGAGAGPDAQGRRGAAVVPGVGDLRHRRRELGGTAAGDHRGADPVRGTRLRGAAGRAGLRRRWRRTESRAGQLDSRQGLRHGQRTYRGW